MNKMVPALSEVDVLIVGAGPTGLTLACELEKRGIHYRLIDQKARTATTSRAVALHSRTLEIFSYMGIARSIAARSVHITGVTVYNQMGFLMKLKLLHALNTPCPHVLLLPQNETEQILSQHLAFLGGKVEYSKQLVNFRQEEGIVIAHIATVDDESVVIEEVYARWLIGCDGAHSYVRHVVDIPFTGHTLSEEFLLADVDLDWEKSKETTHLWLHQDGLFATLPLPHQKRWRLFVNISTSSNLHAPLASVEIFQKLFRERTGDTKTTISNLAWSSNFKIHERLVAHYRYGNVFLTGDAAHVHSPFGGQGMNTGIQDAYNLAWKLALVIHKKAPEGLLDTYEQERKPVASQVVRNTHLLTNVLISQGRVWRFIRDQGIVRLFKLNRIQRLISQRGSELNITYRPSTLTPRIFSWRKEYKSGSRVQQAYFYLGLHKQNTSLFDLLQTPMCLLLLFAGTQAKTNYLYLAHLAASLRDSLGDVINTYVVLSKDTQQADSLQKEEIILDYQNELYQLYGNKKESMCFIRPDGYVGLCTRLNEKALWAYLHRNFT